MSNKSNDYGRAYEYAWITTLYKVLHKIRDVRDIIISRDGIDWEIGLSIKHNHEAIKHSRLSHKLDFGKEWFKVPCSNEYWHKVLPIFDMLKIKQIDGIKWLIYHQKIRMYIFHYFQHS